jgi:hypothetical protein
MTRQQDVLDARAAADQWANEHGLPPSGGYSGQWYLNDYLYGWWPDGWLKWWAIYGIAPGSIIGGDIVAHQYGSTPVDMDVLLESEIVDSGGTGGDVDDQERKQYQDRIDGLVTTVADIADRIGDELLTEAQRSSVRKTVVRNIVKEMQAERVQAVGPRP